MISISKLFKTITSSEPAAAHKPVEPKPIELPKTRKELKIFLKDLVVQIRSNSADGIFNHNLYKANPNTDPGLLKKTVSGVRLSRDYRHHHIAYCELRGRTRDQIEKPGKYNQPDEKKIQAIKEAYSGTLVHPGA